MRLDPVFILMQPRSGSSMIAEIFHRHGLWVGRIGTGERYPTWENAGIRRDIKRLCYRAGDPPLSLRTLKHSYGPRDVVAVFERYVPPATDWMHKIPIDRWTVIRDAFPAARYVFVRRPEEAVIASLVEKVAATTERQAREHVRARHAYLDALAKEHDIPVVQSQRVIDGDLATLDAALARCGIEMDRGIVARVVNRDLWKH